MNEVSDIIQDLNGYYTPYGFMGLVGNKYILFATYEEYYEYIHNLKTLEKGEL